MNATSAGTSSPAGERSTGADPARVGRKLGLALYLSFLGYMVVVGFGTFIDGVFHPPADHIEGRPDCTLERTRLAESLRARANAAMTEADRSSARPFFATWDSRYEGLRPYCSEDREFRLLERLRYRVEIQLDRFERDTSRAFRRVLGEEAAEGSTR